MRLYGDWLCNKGNDNHTTFFGRLLLGKQLGAPTYLFENETNHEFTPYHRFGYQSRERLLLLP